MKLISMMIAIQLCGAYQKMALSERKTLQEQRLFELATYAKAHSPGALKKRFDIYGVEDKTVTLSEEMPRQHPVNIW